MASFNQRVVASAERPVTSNVRRCRKQCPGLGDGRLDMDRGQVGIDGRITGPFFDRRKLRWLGGILQKLVADTARFLARRIDDFQQDRFQRLGLAGLGEKAWGGKLPIDGANETPSGPRRTELFDGIGPRMGPVLASRP